MFELSFNEALTDENKRLLKIVSEWSNIDQPKLVNNALTLYFKDLLSSLECISVNGNDVSALG